ncbi:unnamed protein product [Calypogeia fissa]
MRSWRVVRYSRVDQWFCIDRQSTSDLNIIGAVAQLRITINIAEPGPQLSTHNLEFIQTALSKATLVPHNSNAAARLLLTQKEQVVSKEQITPFSCFLQFDFRVFLVIWQH